MNSGTNFMRINKDYIKMKNTIDYKNFKITNSTPKYRRKGSNIV